MKTITLIQSVFHELYRRYVVYGVDKLFNTLYWLMTRKDNVIVLNVWLRHRGVIWRKYNFGDDINYAVVKYLTHKKVVSYIHSYVSLFHPVNYMCIGSIVDTITNEKSIIWGSGAMYGEQYREFVPPKRVIAVRGPLTREYLMSKGVECPEIYGDPALILPLIYKSHNNKKYKIGLIPHYSEYKIDKVQQFRDIYGTQVLVIDLHHYSDWRDIVDRINECEIIASSSLHGLIVSDAYKIPNVWVKLTDSVKGGAFKYLDYFGGVGRNTSNPLDFTKTAIDMSLIINQGNLYQPINYNPEPLISVCPFRDCQ